MSEMISFGAGVNSVAMTIMLVNDGWQGPIVFADPGAEYPETYCYMDMFEHEWLEPRGLTITQLSPLTDPELYSPSYRLPLEAKCLRDRVVPFISLRWCTAEYKRRPLTKWGQANGITIHLIGISWEEAHRARRAKQSGRETAYPLIGRMIDRDGCKEIIREAGLPLPRKSGCFFCPFSRKLQWRLLYEDHPGLFQRAVDMEDATRKTDPWHKVVQLGKNLGLPLRVARDRWRRQIAFPLMLEIEYEYYQMCECRV